MARTYRLYEGSLQHRFQQSRAKIQFFGGGFANGKTASACIKALTLAKDYPGSNGLIARSTYPKLNDTIRKEFFKWCPEHWIKRRPTKDDNTLVMTNGTHVNFRYVAQQGKSAESSTSNLLSATYDWIIVDQIEDPEISEKDFDDLLGRLRGMARYNGNDPSMPRTGPRFFIITSNPTRNWVYRKLIKPLHDYQQRGVKSDDLIVDPDTGEPLMELFEGSTYENKDNLEPDFIKTLEATYRGQMRDRFLMGQWAAYEGLVYPQFDESQHMLRVDDIRDYYTDLLAQRIKPTILEGYDHGLAVPSAYLWGFADHLGNIFIVDGWYEKEMPIEDGAQLIHDVRNEWSSSKENLVWADPQLFRRGVGDKKTVGRTVAEMFREEGIIMRRGNNEILNGIAKIQGYLGLHGFHKNPLTGLNPAPYLYISDKVEFLRNEFTDYYWKRDNDTNEHIDKPNDKKDHALDALKYMVSEQPRIAEILKRPVEEEVAHMRWQESDLPGRQARAHRHV